MLLSGMVCVIEKDTKHGYKTAEQPLITVLPVNLYLYPLYIWISFLLFILFDGERIEIWLIITIKQMLTQLKQVNVFFYKNACNTLLCGTVIVCQYTLF